MRGIAIIIVSLMVAGCQPTPVGKPKSSNKNLNSKATTSTPVSGGTIVDASIGDASNLIPMLSGDASSHQISGLIYPGLITYTPEWKIEGELAESFEILNEGKTIVFHLRKGIKWEDGHPFTSADVMFGYKTIINKDTPTPYANDYLQVSKAEAPDAYTFIVHYDKPFAPALASWGNLVILPKHLLVGKDISKSPLTRKPMGIGPYRFKDWKAQESIKLEAGDDYFKGEVYIKKYVYRVIPDSATQFLELKAGGIDEMSLTPIQYTKQTNTKEFESKFQKFRYLANGYTYLGFNLARQLFKDKRVRQAISYAINKEEIIEGALLGLGKPATGPFKPGTWPFNKNVKKYGYNPEMAKKLLADAGWKYKNGLLYKNGKKFEFTIVTNQGNAQRKKTAEIIQRRLKAIGMSVKIRVIEWASFIKEFINKREFDATILGWSLSPEPDPYSIWHSSQTGEHQFNFVDFKNKEVDELLEKGRRTFDIEERKKAYYKIQEILAEEQPYTFLYNAEALPVVSKKVMGIKKYETGIGYNWSTTWWIPTAMQR